MASYDYDARDRRKSRTVGAAKTVFVTDAEDREVLEYSGNNGVVQRWFSYGEGVDEPLNQVNVSAGTRNTLIPDMQGSLIGFLSSTGATARAGFQPFGQNPSLAGTASAFRYTGRRLDPETAGTTSQPSGLYYYRARMYSPTWGRFLQPDPIGYAGGDTNLYAYVGNDPLNYVDPTGECPMCVGAIIGGGLDFALQVGTGLSRGQSFRQAVRNVDYVSVAISATAGAVGAFGAGRVATVASRISRNVVGSVRRKVTTNIVANVTGNAAIGAATGAVSQVAKNNYTTQKGNVGVAALGGGAGGAAGTVAGALLGRTQTLANATGNFIATRGGQVAAPLSSYVSAGEVAGTIGGGLVDQALTNGLGSFGSGQESKGK